MDAAGAAAALMAAAFAAATASFSRSMSCFDFTKTPVGKCTFAAALGVSAASVLGGEEGIGAGAVATAAGVEAGFLAANSSRRADALILSTVLETDFTSGLMILRSLRSAISSLFSKPSSSASLWMRMLMQR